MLYYWSAQYYPQTIEQFMPYIKEALLLKYFAGDYCLLVWLVLLSCKTNLTLESVFFGESFSAAWDQNILHCLSEKRYYSIVRIASVRYIQTEDCNTRLHENLNTWQLGFISLWFWCHYISICYRIKKFI